MATSRLKNRKSGISINIGEGKMRVWKVGSRWGNMGESVLWQFIDYGMVFVGGTDDGRRQGDYYAVMPGDLFVIGHGLCIVALAKALERFKPYSPGELSLKGVDQHKYFDDGTVICKVDIRNIPTDKRFTYSKMSRFCSVKSEDIVKNAQLLWNQLAEETQSGDFDIQARTVSLLPCQSGQDAILSRQIRYRIPIYQRPYSWGEKEIGRLFQDLRRGIENDFETIFMGTMQVSDPLPLNSDGSLRRYDIIDGQQRVTTFVILAEIMKRMGFPLTDDGCKLETTLHSFVNKGAAQDEINEFFCSSIDDVKMAECHQSPYMRNAYIIYQGLTELLDASASQSKANAHTMLIEYFRNKIRLVVIETRAGLSKTLQIFNIINTTGLDLNGSDVFKIRFFEYLTDKHNENQNVFDKISAIYRSIEDIRKADGPITSMSQIMTIMQTTIVMKYGLNVALVDYGTDRFFEQLFDCLLGIHTWQNFNPEKVAQIVEDRSGPLSVEGMNTIIERTRQFHRLHNQKTVPMRDAVRLRMMWQTRYGWRYWYLPIIFAYQLGSERAEEFFDELMKLAISYSMINERTVNRAHSCIREACRAIFSGDEASETAIRILRQCRLDVRNDTERAFRDYSLAWNPTWKRIACRLTEYLMHCSQDEMPAPDVVGAIFDSAIDIEHIQSSNDSDIERREKTTEEWGAVLNGLGNLAILESSINRSISNEPFHVKTDSKRKPSYHDSNYLCITELCRLQAWTKDAAIARKEKLVSQIMRWLYS